MSKKIIAAYVMAVYAMLLLHFNLGVAKENNKKLDIIIEIVTIGKKLDNIGVEHSEKNLTLEVLNGAKQ